MCVMETEKAISKQASKIRGTETENFSILPPCPSNHVNTCRLCTTNSCLRCSSARCCASLPRRRRRRSLATAFLALFCHFDVALWMRCLRLVQRCLLRLVLAGYVDSSCRVSREESCVGNNNSHVGGVRLRKGGTMVCV